MGRAVVRCKEPTKKASKPAAQTWRNRLQKPWTAYCDTRAIMAIMMRLHEQERQKLLLLDQIVDFIAKGDLGCLPSLRRADIIEAFYDRHDVADLVPVLVIYLVMDGVLIPECGHHVVSERFRINAEDIPALNMYHATLDHGRSSSAKFTVVS